MVNILAFPGKHTSSSQAHQDALKNDVALPVVTANTDGTLIVSRPTEHTRLTGDWSNQEVADLYRVEALLVQAGIRISTDRGVSDENEPWFVFCREDGEVFVHLARIDGQYLLDSPGLGGLLEGPDFPSLIDRFVSQVAARSEPKDNVVTFRPRMLHDQSVRLHPAVMLAALVWTLFLASDDIIGTAEAADSLASDGGQIPDSVMQQGDHGLASASVFSSGFDAFGDQASNEKSSLSSTSLSAGQNDRQLGSHQDSGRSLNQQEGRFTAPVTSAVNSATTSQSIAASLAVIALGYGMHGPHPLTDADGVKAQLAALALDAIPEGSQSDVAMAEADGSPIELQQAAKDAPVETAATSATIVYDTKIYAPLSAVSGFTADSEGHGTEDGKSGQFPAHLVEEISTEDAGVVVAVSNAQARTVTPAQETLATVPASVTDAQNVLSLVSKYLGLISEYQMGDTTVSATLDLESLDKVLVQLGDVANDTTPDKANPEGAPAPMLGNPTQNGSSILGAKFASYDEQAKKFVHAFILDAGSIEMLQINSELLLVDMTAIDEKTDYAIVRSWITEDGHVISTVGHYQAFVEYGLA